MSTAAIPGKGLEGLIHGVNVSFIVTAIISIVGLILAFFIHDEKEKKISSR
ncbi:hypothetical protein MACH08_12720 [Oceanobacillus kimchii]|uniref:Uncharacterized protein n=2 Tax=Bacillaceae TaxID=186817 RepID=A0ABQ5TIM0_9BACI|nr:hypothetical protein MACH08_12720 [Oceanobacillus kimchii]